MTSSPSTWPLRSSTPCGATKRPHRRRPPSPFSTPSFSYRWSWLVSPSQALVSPAFVPLPLRRSFWLVLFGPLAFGRLHQWLPSPLSSTRKIAFFHLLQTISQTRPEGRHDTESPSCTLRSHVGGSSGADGTNAAAATAIRRNYS